MRDGVVMKTTTLREIESSFTENTKNIEIKRRELTKGAGELEVLWKLKC